MRRCLHWCVHQKYICIWELLLCALRNMYVESPEKSPRIHLWLCLHAFVNTETDLTPYFFGLNWYWHWSVHEEQYLHRSVPERWTCRWSWINKSSRHFCLDVHSQSAAPKPKKKKICLTKPEQLWVFKCPSQKIKPPLPSASQPYRIGAVSGRIGTEASVGGWTWSIFFFWVEIACGASKLWIFSHRLGAAMLHADPLRQRRGILQKKNEKEK